MRLATVTARFSPRRPVWEFCGSFQATSPREGARRWMPCPSVTQLRNVAMLLEPFDNRGSDRVRTQCGRSGREVGRERAGIQGFADRGLQAACLVRQAQRMPQQQRDAEDGAVGRSEEHKSGLQARMRITNDV